MTHIYIKGVTERFGFDVSELRNFNYLSKTKQRERLMGCLYTALIGYLPFFGNIPLEMFYIFIGVGLSALLVSTDRGNAKAKIRGTGIRLAPRLFCIYMVMSQISEFVLQSHGATQHNRCVTDTYMVIRKIITKPFNIKN